MQLKNNIKETSAIIKFDEKTIGAILSSRYQVN